MTRLRTLQPTLRTVSTAAAKPQPKVKAAHYYTPEHRAWAAEGRRLCGGACQDCGRTDARLYADHVIELQDGGAPFDAANRRMRCGSCHGLKTAKERARRQAA